MAKIDRNIIVYGNDFDLYVDLKRYDKLESEFIAFDLSQCTDVRVFLICSKHGELKDLKYEVLYDSTIKVPIDHRLLHIHASYGIVVEGYDENEVHWRYELMPSEGFLVIPNTSGLKVEDSVSTIMISGTVGWGISAGDLSQYYTKNETEQYVQGELEDYYDKGETDGLLNNKVDTNTLVNDYYNKNTVDNLLDAKADVSDLNNYYDKAQTNSLLNQKANVSDLNNYYDKTETNALLDEKANSADLATVATTGSYNDLINKPIIPAGQIQSDWSQTNPSEVDYIKNKPNLATVATSGSYNDLNHKPDLSIYATEQELGNYYDKGETDGLLNNKVDTSTLVNDYYNKNTVDNLLDTKADTSDLNNYYDKTETNSLLNQKANTSDLNNYYDKTQTDSLLNQKANVSDLNNKQDTLVSGTNIKTINNESILGSGNIDIQGGGGENHDNADEATANALYELNERLSEAEINIDIIPTEVQAKIDELETNVEQSLDELPPKFDEIDEEFKSTALVIEELHETAQPTLVSGTNIKTINNESILGSGNITIGGGVQSNWNETNTTSLAYIQNKPSIQTNYVIDYSKTYLTFEAIQDTTFTFTRKELQYSLDNGSTWTSLSVSTASPTVTAGNKIMWKQNNLRPDANYGIGKFSATGNFNAYGNVMSLYYGDNFIGQTDLTGKEYTFAKLFYNNTYLKDASNLILPAKTLSNACYSEMFYGCTALKLAPKLPAITLATNCYAKMFQDCKALTTAPELPATTLENYCYKSMFEGCTHLNFIKCKAINKNATNCLQYWTTNVAASGKFVKAFSSTSWSSGTSGIPSNWTVYTYSEYEYPYRYELTGMVKGYQEGALTDGIKIDIVSALPANPAANTIYIIQ